MWLETYRTDFVSESSQFNGFDIRKREGRICDDNVPEITGVFLEFQLFNFIMRVKLGCLYNVVLSNFHFKINEILGFPLQRQDFPI